MSSSTALAAAALLLSVLPCNAYWILDHAPLMMTRMDPIISPGSISQHEHNILGGSKFAATYNYDDLITSSCTTAVVSIDKSNYWAPQLYYYEPVAQTFQAIPSYSKTYYLQRPGSKNERIMAFPKGLKMVAGNPYRRTFDASSYADQAVSYVCLDYYNDHSGDADWEQRNNFFNHNCPDGLRAQVFFPSCWDGVNLDDSDDHTSHLAYPIDNYQGGDCPASHPVHFVGLFYEFIYSVGDFPFNDASQPTWVFANGDTTGYSFHGDFTNGWPAGEDSVLQKALDTCGDETYGVVESCVAFQPYLDAASAAACKPENDVVNEPNGWGYTISKLPGDNPLWSGNSSAKPSTSGYVESSGYTTGQSILPSGWSRIGCIAEPTSGRALNAASWTSTNMTNAACANYCDGLKLPLSGVEYGQECFCDSKIQNGATSTTIASDRCSVTCTGLKTENCGGSSTMTLMENPDYYDVPTLPSGWAPSDCMTEATDARALASASTSSSSMTVETCVNYCQGQGYSIAGMEYSSQCYCANAFSTGSVVATDGKCNMACSGNLAQTCGGPDRLSTYKNANAKLVSSVSSSAALPSTSSASPSSTPVVIPGSSTAKIVATSSSAVSTPPSLSSSKPSSSSVPAASTSTLLSFTTSSSLSPAATSSSVSISTSSIPAGWTYQGCRRDVRGYTLTGNMTKSTTNSYTQCAKTCTSLGFKMMGVEYQSQCFCGDSLANGGGTTIDESNCSFVCPGERSTMCGGNWAFNYFTLDQ